MAARSPIADAPARSEVDDRRDALFDDLARLRDQSGTAALAGLAVSKLIS